MTTASRFSDAALECKKLPADFWATPECVSRVLLGQGKTDEAIQVLETRYRQGVAAGSEVQGYLAYAYAKAGRLSDVDVLAARMPAINPFSSALIFAGLGDKDRCFEALQRPAIAGPGRIGWALGFPEYAILRGDPRMTKLRTQAGLPMTVTSPN